MLELQHICYDVEQDGEDKGILRDIDLTIDERFVAITGPNGGGKSTLAKIIAGIYTPTSGRILLDGEDITSRIRTEEIGKAASSVAAYQKVREKLVEIQKGLAKEQSVIMDGRDIGTKVLPDAEVKIYLDASVEERAKRRVGELEAQGKTADLETIREEIAQRDYQDMHRENSPLCRAEDAVNVDTTGLDIPAVTAKLLALIAEKTK